MTGHLRRPRSGLRNVVALSITLIALTTPVAAASNVSATKTVPAPVIALAPAALLPAWDGGIDLYRDGVFTTQKSWLWCTAAGVQIVHNIVERDEDHTTAGQRRYFDWMRSKNHYELPESAGIDPQGWTAG